MVSFFFLFNLMAMKSSLRSFYGEKKARTRISTVSHLSLKGNTACYGIFLIISNIYPQGCPIKDRILIYSVSLKGR